MHHTKVSYLSFATKVWYTALQGLHQPLGFGRAAAIAGWVPTTCRTLLCRPFIRFLQTTFSLRAGRMCEMSHACALNCRCAPAPAVSLGLPGGSPPASIARQHLSRLSLSRHHHHRCSLSAQAVLTWLQRHPAVVSGTGRLLLDLSHHSYHDFDRQALEQLLGALPQLASVCLVGAVEGTDAYEPLGEQMNRLQQLAAV